MWTSARLCNPPIPCAESSAPQGESSILRSYRFDPHERMRNPVKEVYHESESIICVWSDVREVGVQTKQPKLMPKPADLWSANGFFCPDKVIHIPFPSQRLKKKLQDSNLKIDATCRFTRLSRQRKRCKRCRESRKQRPAPSAGLTH
jgi:hypothetical protein